jgi:hypothetical protein
MQVVVNGAYVSGKVKIGNYLHWASMVLLVAGFLLSLPYGADFLGQQTAIMLAYAALIGALLLLNFGRSFTRRWGPKFRQDQWLVLGIKGLDNKATLFNYPSPDLPDHVLVAPTGLYVLLAKPNGGTIRFDGLRWSRGSMAGTLLRGLGEGGLGNPVQDMQKAMEQLRAYLTTNGSEDLIKGLHARPIIVFTNPSARLQVDNRNPGLEDLWIVHLNDLKTKFRRAKPILDNDKVEELKRVIGREVAP